MLFFNQRKTVRGFDILYLTFNGNKMNLKQVLMTTSLAIVIMFNETANAIPQYTYAYTYSSGDTLIGSFDGSVNGDLIRNITNFTAIFNGLSLGNLSYEQSVNNGIWQTGGAVISISGTSNNFLFKNTTWAGSMNGTNLPYVASIQQPIPQANNFFQDYILTGNYTDANGTYDFVNDQPLITQNWSVTQNTNTNSVPEPSTIVLLVSGLLVCGAAGRKKNQESASFTL